MAAKFLSVIAAGLWCSSGAHVVERFKLCRRQILGAPREADKKPSEVNGEN